MSWDDLAAGRECPFDEPRIEPNDYWDSVARLTASTLCLSKNQAYRGQCLLIFNPRHVTRVDQLTDYEWTSFMDDLNRAIKAIATYCRPDHLNVASEGNVIPHLHWHIIPRYRTDPRWGAPITMTTMEEMAIANISDGERMAMISDLKSLLG
jgi:diadenosine tetraphosphate (Ap4A) HIT family hydrolase